MKKRRRRVATVPLCCIIVAASALMLFGADFWIKKPYSDWNEQEALTLLRNSPWSYTTSIPGNYGGSSVPTMMGGGARATATTGGLGGSNTVPMYVRWQSSLKIRQALARYNQLQGALSESEIKQFLEQPMPDYTIRHQLRRPGAVRNGHFRVAFASHVPYLQEEQREEDRIEGVQLAQGAGGQFWSVHVPA